MSFDNHLAELHMDNYIKTAIDIANYFDDKDERDKILNDLSNIVELNCKLKEKLKYVPKKSQELIKKYISIDIDEINYEEVAKKLSNELESFEPNLSKNNDFQQFKSKLKTLRQENIDEDADVAVTVEEVNIIDPFTKKRIQEPVKNKCGHVYDLTTVNAVVKANNRTRCPVIGCKSTDFIELSNLTTDIITKAYLKKHPK